MVDMTIVKWACPNTCVVNTLGIKCISIRDYLILVVVVAGFCLFVWNIYHIIRRKITNKQNVKVK